MKITRIDVGRVDADRRAQWLRMRKELYSGVDETFHEEEMDYLVSSEVFACFLVEDPERQAFGFAEVSLRNIVDGVLGGPVGYLEGLYLDPVLRGQGHGEALIGQVVEWLRGRGCSHLATDTELDNRAAQRYYEKLGFTRKWTIVQYLKEIDGAP